MTLVAPRGAVLSFLYRQAARGRKLARLPLIEYLHLIRARAEHHRWWLLTFQGLMRAFDDNAAADRFDKSRDQALSFAVTGQEEVAAFRRRVLAEVAALEAVIAEIREAGARGA